ncbi:MAG: hypothetical protein K6F69_06320 [Treponema sp.]|nr:hypothetical protein [Treponema sp.]
MIHLNGADYCTRLVIREDVNCNYYYDSDSTSVEKAKRSMEFLSSPNEGTHKN